MRAKDETRGESAPADGRTERAPAAAPPHVAAILQAQKSAGNRAVAAMFARPGAEGVTGRPSPAPPGAVSRVGLWDLLSPSWWFGGSTSGARATQQPDTAEQHEATQQPDTAEQHEATEKVTQAPEEAGAGTPERRDAEAPEVDEGAATGSDGAGVPQLPAEGPGSPPADGRSSGRVKGKRKASGTPNEGKEQAKQGNEQAKQGKEQANQGKQQAHRPKPAAAAVQAPAPQEPEPEESKRRLRAALQDAAAQRNELQRRRAALQGRCPAPDAAKYEAVVTELISAATDLDTARGHEAFKQSHPSASTLANVEQTLTSARRHLARAQEDLVRLERRHGQGDVSTTNLIAACMQRLPQQYQRDVTIALQRGGLAAAHELKNAWMKAQQDRRTLAATEVPEIVRARVGGSPRTRPNGRKYLLIPMEKVVDGGKLHFAFPYDQVKAVNVDMTQDQIEHAIMRKSDAFLEPHVTNGDSRGPVTHHYYYGGTFNPGEGTDPPPEVVALMKAEFEPKAREIVAAVETELAARADEAPHVVRNAAGELAWAPSFAPGVQLDEWLN